MRPAFSAVFFPKYPFMDAVALEEELRLATLRVHKLGAAVEAEEAALIRTTLTEAEVVASCQAPRRATAKGMPTEGQLIARVSQAEELLRHELSELRESLADPNVMLALAVTQGVDGYYGDVHALRQRSNPAHGLSAGAATPAASLNNLKKERDRLQGAVRSLAIETESMAREARIVAESKAQLVAALRRREAKRGVRFR